VLLFFGSAVFWLLVGTLFALLASFKTTQWGHCLPPPMPNPWESPARGPCRQLR
jgi:hypothetical protein